MGKRLQGEPDPLRLTRVNVRQLRVFMRYIAKHDLWDELEWALHKQGIDDLLVSVDPIHAVQDHIEASLRGRKKKPKSAVRIYESPH